MNPDSTRIRLQPANTQRIPFLGQVFLGVLWIGYTVSLIVTGEGASDMHFLHYVFLVFSLVYLGYVLVHNAPHRVKLVEKIVVESTATVKQASWPRRLLVRTLGTSGITELYEVGFEG